MLTSLQTLEKNSWRALAALECYGNLVILFTYLFLKLKWIKHMVPPVLEMLPDTLTDVKMSVDWFEVPSHRGF